jgi:hypothetical protein
LWGHWPAWHLAVLHLAIAVTIALALSGAVALALHRTLGVVAHLFGTLTDLNVTSSTMVDGVCDGSTREAGTHQNG